LTQLLLLLFECWKSIYFPKCTITADELQCAGRINDLTGAITMVKHGVGSGIFPKHCVQRELDAGELESFPANGDQSAKAFPIWLARRGDTTESARVRTVIDAFWSMTK
jgi:DNA-binding transcriptional LysR family regulator